MSSSAIRRVSWHQDQATIPFPGLFEPETDDASRDLRYCYQKFLLPSKRFKSESHQQKYLRVLDLWEETTVNPEVGSCDSDDEALQTFQCALQKAAPKRKKLSPATINNYCHYIMEIFRVCTPRDRWNPQGKGIIRAAPWVEDLEVASERPFVASRRQIGMLYEAAAVATWPSSRLFPAPLWWRILYASAFTYGPRSSDLAPIKEKGSGLTRSNLRYESDCPIGGLDLSNPDGWLVYRPDKTKKKKPELVLPLTSVMRRHFDALPRSTGDALLLPCTTHYEDFKQQRRLIEAAAGINAAITLQVIRRSATSYWHVLHKDVGDYVTGHAPRGVNAINYQEKLIPLLEQPNGGARMLDRFGYPEAFVKGPA